MNQRRTIVGGCDYSIETLQQLKRDLMDVGAPNKDINWAIGGMVVALTGSLLRICHDVFTESMKTQEPDARADLQQVKSQFSDFIDTMVDHG